MWINDFDSLIMGYTSAGPTGPGTWSYHLPDGVTVLVDWREGMVTVLDHGEVVRRLRMRVSLTELPGEDDVDG